MPVHIVEQGDSMTSIAEQYGFFWETLWNHEENAALRRERSSPNIMMAGDQVFVPDLREKDVGVQTDRKHRFRLKGIPARLNLCIKDDAGEPRPGVAYTIELDGQTIEETTDGEGKISHVIPPRAQKAELWLETGEHWVLNLGHVNPVEYTSGVQVRLKNLAYYHGEISGEMDEETTDAIRDFQSAQGLSVTGEPDQATRDALVATHGS